MYGRPSHIAYELAFERPAASLVHHTRVILHALVPRSVAIIYTCPEDDISVIFPYDFESVLVLGGVPQEVLNDLFAFLLGETVDVVGVVSDIQVRPSTRLVGLHKSMSSHEVVFRAHALRIRTPAQLDGGCARASGSRHSP